MPFKKKKVKNPKEQFRPCGKVVNTVTEKGGSRTSKLCGKRKGHFGKCG